ncbi:reverse transcriptase/maturase family protein, partial [Mariniblastus sp.]|nr:reverse transcriptase/maturase family protein [Mariniblastus sp.]
MQTFNTGDTINDFAMNLKGTKSAPSEQDSKHRRHYARLQGCYLGNRVSAYSPPLPAYELAVNDWALKSKANMHEHCKTLLQAIANPMLLEPSLNELLPKLRLAQAEQEMLACKYGKWKWLRGLRDVLLKQQFTTGKYKKYKIPKPGKQGFRTIEVPDTDTRIVAKTMLKVLTPLLDPSFYPLSIGFRPGRSTLHGLAAAEQLVKRGMTHWVKCDIRDAFGQIPNQTLFDVLKSRLKGSSIMGLVEEVLDKDRKRGIPQGVAISPLAMNVYLDHFLDQWWVEKFPETCLVRYADDILIACPSRQSAINAFNELDKRATTIGMPIKENLTDALFDLIDGDVVDWLGFQIRLTENELDFSLGVKSWDRLEFKLQEVKVREVKGESYTQAEINSIGFGRVLEKAVAIEEHK